MDPFIGEIRIFSFTYAPQDWAFCDGAQLVQGQSPALYSLIGTIYGGASNGSLFNLPNLQSKAPMGASTMINGNIQYLNVAAGTESVTLNSLEMPAHTHVVSGETTPIPSNQTNVPGPTTLPNALVVDSNIIPAFNSPPNATMYAGAISPAGGSSQGVTSPHENRQPFIAMNFCICLDGVYPDLN